jgi:hypothetical protein
VTGHDGPAPGIRRAAPADRDQLIQLIREFCAIDQHPFDFIG